MIFYNLSEKPWQGRVQLAGAPDPYYQCGGTGFQSPMVPQLHTYIRIFVHVLTLHTDIRRYENVPVIWRHHAPVPNPRRNFLLLRRLKEKKTNPAAATS